MLVRPGLLYENFTATRGEVPIDYLHQVKLKDGKKRLTMPALEKYAGKPVLVDLFGTWCTNCIDMVPFLREMKQKHAALQILGVAVELVEDRAYAEQQVKRYRERHGIDWEIEIVLGDADKLSDLLPPELAGIEGVPISVFITRDGTVHAVHTGFAGPATGAEHERVRAEVERLIQEIL
jgi:thiol-disulfide isomerase/thioredoxin